ncbi:MAG: hypothetical protein ACAH11_04165 [Sphingomonas sp.]
MAEFLMMDAVTAATLRGATQGDAARLDPRATGGGQFALPVAVLADGAFGWLGDVLGELQVQALEPEAWPPGAA